MTMKQFKKICFLLTLLFCLAACGEAKDLEPELSTQDIAYDLEMAREMIEPMEKAAAWLSVQETVSRDEWEGLQEQLCSAGFKSEAGNLYAGFIDGILIEDENVTEFPILTEGVFKPTIYHEGVEITYAVETRTVFTYPEKAERAPEERRELVIHLEYTGEDEPLLEEWFLEYIFTTGFFPEGGEAEYQFTSFNGAYNIGGEGVTATLLPLKELPEYEKTSAP